MILKISNVRFKVACHIRATNGSSQHTHLDSNRWDIELVDYQYLTIKERGKQKILLIVPFENCICMVPQDDADFSALDEAFDDEPEEEESALSTVSPDVTMMDVIAAKRKGRPTNAEMERRRQTAGIRRS